MQDEQLHSMVEEGDEHSCSNTHSYDGGPGVCTIPSFEKLVFKLNPSNPHENDTIYSSRS